KAPGVSLEAIGDAALAEIVGSHLDQDLVAGEHADSVLAHAAGSVGDNLVLVLELHAEGGVGQQLRDDTGKLQQFFLRLSLPSRPEQMQSFQDPRKLAQNLAELRRLHNGPGAAPTIRAVTGESFVAAR